MNVKQVIVVRTDLNMRKGKMCAQVAHASMMWLKDMLQCLGDLEEPINKFLDYAEKEWLFGNYTKVVVGVSSERELLELVELAVEKGIEAHTVTDLGLTEFNGIPTLTCAAFGPDKSERLDAITGGLKLL